MTLKDIATGFTKQISDVTGFSHPVTQWLRNDKLQVLQLSAITGEYRVSPEAPEVDRLVSCNEAKWQKLSK